MTAAEMTPRSGSRPMRARPTSSSSTASARQQGPIPSGFSSKMGATLISWPTTAAAVVEGENMGSNPPIKQREVPPPNRPDVGRCGAAGHGHHGHIERVDAIPRRHKPYFTLFSITNTTGRSGDNFIFNSLHWIISSCSSEGNRRPDSIIKIRSQLAHELSSKNNKLQKCPERGHGRHDAAS